MLDFEQAKEKHLLFKSRLRSILYDIPVEEGPVLSHHECGVGKWIYGYALEAYGHLPEMIELEKVHAEIHQYAKTLIDLYKAGKPVEAKNGLSNIEDIADKLVALLCAVESKVGDSSPEKNRGSAEHIKLDEYYSLLKSNAELDKKIKQQIADSSSSALRFETVLAALREGIIIQDAKGVLQIANNSAALILGMSMDQLHGRTSLDTIWNAMYEDGSAMPGEEHPPMVALRTKRPQENRVMGITKPNGNITWLQVNSQPLMDKDTNEIAGVVSSFFDITSDRKVTADLRESESRFRLLAEATPQMILIMNSHGEAEYLNPQWITFTGLQVPDLIKLGWQHVVHPEDVAVIIEKYNAIKLDGKAAEFESRYKRADGIYRWHLNRFIPIKNEKGNVELWIGTATDVNDLKELQAQKDDFISIASHELKTPVTSLKASLQLLYRVKDNPAFKILAPLIEQSNKSLERVSILIEDLLDASKVNGGQLHLNKSTFILSKIIEDCCHHVRSEGVYSIITRGDVEVEIYADAEKIDQVVVNFVNNAIKYAPSSKEIVVLIERMNTMVKVSVTDKGPGILPEKIRHLFDRYYRVDTSGIQYSGLGLGLYISSEIIKKHNGEIGVDSQLGKGSTFWFTLPLA